MSLNGHKSDCSCPACRGKVKTAEREREEAEQAATVRAVARLGAWMAAQLARQGGGSAPDVLRQALGRDDALRVLKLAGMDAGQVRGNWAADAPAAPRQASVNGSSSTGGYAGDPDHDPRVTSVMQRPGATMAEINQVRRQVAAEYDARRLERQARDAIYYGRDRAPAAMGASIGPDGAPVQRSVIHEDVPELGSEV